MAISLGIGSIFLIKYSAIFDVLSIAILSKPEFNPGRLNCQLV